jgi:hypothetical protein
MDPIDSLEALRPILQSLMAKNLIVALTPEGRGQVVAHNLYTEREMNELRRRYAEGAAATISGEPPVAAPSSRPTSAAPATIPSDVLTEMRVELAELRAGIARLREENRTIKEKLDQVVQQMDEFRRVLE